MKKFLLLALVSLSLTTTQTARGSDVKQNSETVLLKTSFAPSSFYCIESVNNDYDVDLVLQNDCFAEAVVAGADEKTDVLFSNNLFYKPKVPLGFSDKHILNYSNDTLEKESDPYYVNKFMISRNTKNKISYRPIRHTTFI